MKSRAWKRQLKSVNSENQAEIYQTLCILMSEQDPKQFETKIAQFVVVWETKEPAFVKYFSEYYHTRAGKVIMIILCMHNNYNSDCTAEKWAKCYRHFKHGDTDTNMYLERYFMYNVIVEARLDLRAGPL